MSESLRSFTGRTIDDIPLTEYLAGSSNTAIFRTTFSGQTGVVKLFALDSAKADAQLAHLQLTEKLAHPHLLRTLKTGRAELDGTQLVYIVTEFAEENLAQVLLERALTPPEAHEVLQSTSDALRYLHSHGFVHADLKPANIMASGDQLKLSIDGLQRIGEPLSREPGPHDAPEAAQKLSPASDIWSLAVTLAEVLTQQLPPWSTSDATGPTVSESVPAPFREIVQHCLLRTPELRWSIAEINAKLNPQPTAAEPPQLTQSSRISPPAVRPSSKRPFIMVAVLAVVVVAIILIPRLSKQQSPQPIPVSAASQPPVQQEAPPPLTTVAGNSESALPAATAAKAKSREDPVAMAPVRRASESVSNVKHITDEPVEDTATETQPEAVSAPGVVRRVMPQVSPRALRTIHGTVRVKVQVNVDSSGNVIDSKFISRGPSEYFARAAEAAARQWKFAPTTTEALPWNLEFDFRRSGTQVRSTLTR